MSKKKQSKKKKRKHVRSRPKGRHIVSQRKLTTLRNHLHRIYKSGQLDTSCCRQCGCCRVMCPQMKYAEADNIIDRIWNEWDRADKRELLVACVHYFFSDSLIKPCLLLRGVECRIYEDRPLNCRLFGMWPEDEYKQRVARFAESSELPKDKIPLNTQCPNVRRLTVTCPDCLGSGFEPPTEEELAILEERQESFERVDFVHSPCLKCEGNGNIDPGPLLAEDVETLFNALDGLDATIGITEQKISSGWNYRTLHDWVLVKFWGEDTLVQWTNMLIANTQDERDEILKIFESMAEDII